MTDAQQWIAGARPRTLTAAVAPVLAGSGCAAFMDSPRLVPAALAAVVAVALQVGVNYANDYSDGVRGTDANRVGPMRLVGSGAASAEAVKRAAFGAFGVAAVAGLVLVAITGHWWLLGVGAASIAAAWFYTGGPRPYGYAGLGEVFVFVFFGMVATLGTTYTQVGRVDAVTLACGSACGFMSVAILVINNLRDISGDETAGKKTLAVRMGEKATRWFFAAMVVAAGLCVIAAALAGPAWTALLGLLPLLRVAPYAKDVIDGSKGEHLITVLSSTGATTGWLGLFLGAGLAYWAAG